MVLAFVQAAAPSAAPPTMGFMDGQRALRGTAAQSPEQDLSATSLAAGTGLAVGAASLRRVNRRRRVVRRQAPASTAVTSMQETERPDIGSNLPDCPKTVWNADDIDIAALEKPAKTCPLLWDANEVKKDMEGKTEREYFFEQRDKILEQLQEHGAIWFRNFDMMKDAAGFRTFFEQLELNPCLDPIHTSGLRAMKEKKDAVYEAVNKPALAGHIVGLHNESTTVKTAKFGAFGCFQPATEGGGEFMLADGAAIAADMDKDVLKRIYENKVRISVSNLDLNFLGALPEGMRDDVQESLRGLILDVVEPKFQMDLEMLYGVDGTNPYRMSAVEHAQPPINRHPVTGQPVWFCNMHNHSRYLRDRRPCTVPEVGMTDVFFGDLSKIPPEDCDHINEVCERNIHLLMMQKGDVVLLDNYRVLHGRKTFKGDRNHVVTWFESQGADNRSQAEEGKPDNFMNELINKTLVDQVDFKKYQA